MATKGKSRSRSSGRFSKRDAKKYARDKAKQEFWLKAANGHLDAGEKHDRAAWLGMKAMRGESRAGRL